MVYVMLIILFAIAKFIVNVVKVKLYPNIISNVHSVSAST